MQPTRICKNTTHMYVLRFACSKIQRTSRRKQQICSTATNTDKGVIRARSEYTQATEVEKVAIGYIESSNKDWFECTSSVVNHGVINGAEAVIASTPSQASRTNCCDKQVQIPSGCQKSWRSVLWATGQWRCCLQGCSAWRSQQFRRNRRLWCWA